MTFSLLIPQSGEGSDSDDEDEPTLRLSNYVMCPHCPFQSMKLTLHMVNHTPSPDRPHKCSYCNFWSSNRQGVQRHELVHLSRGGSTGGVFGGGSGGVSVADGSGNSTPRAETPDRFDEDKWRKQQQKNAEKLEKKMQQDEERKRLQEVRNAVNKIKQAELKKEKLKQQMKSKELSMVYYDMSAVKRGKPIRWAMSISARAYLFFLASRV